MQSGTAVRRSRNLNLERDERDAYLLLLHVFTLSGERPCITLQLEQVARDLAFDDASAARLSDHLVWARLLRKGSGVVSISEEGVAYIKRKARRRRSARLGSWALTLTAP